MTDLKVTEQLDMFEHQPVFASTAVLKKATELRRSLKRDGRVLRIGDTARIVVDVECVGVHHEAAAEDEPLTRIHILKVIDGHYA